MAAELKQVRAQKEYFRLMYEEVEAQLLDIKSRSS